MFIVLSGELNLKPAFLCYDGFSRGSSHASARNNRGSGVNDRPLSQFDPQNHLRAVHLTAQVLTK